MSTCISPALRRTAFTLIEMLVSLAVMTIALAIVGIVFATTSQAASQGAAYSEAHNAARQFIAQIEEDLRYVNPTQSVLLLAGRTQAAALNQDRLEASRFHRVLIGNPARLQGEYNPEGRDLDTRGIYSNPRADILTFITQRPLASAAPIPEFPPNPNNPGPEQFAVAAAGGVMFSPSLVTYGHAALGAAVWDGSSYNFPAPNTVRHIIGAGNNWTRMSPIPLSRWHLARRATLLHTPADGGVLDNNNIPVLTNAAASNIVQGQPYRDGGVWYPGDAAQFNTSLFLRILGEDLYGYGFAGWGEHPANMWPYYFPWGSPFGDDANPTLMQLMFPNGRTPAAHVATVLENLPIDLQSNMAVQMLPGCAWFQVEFLMPEDPRNSLTYGDPTPGTPGNWSSRTDMPLWTSLPSAPISGVPAVYVFLPDTAENRQAVASQVDANGEPLPGSRLTTYGLVIPDDNVLPPPNLNTVQNRIVRLWPYAIRVTVHVYDSRGRLEQPVIRSIVHRFE